MIFMQTRNIPWLWLSLFLLLNLLARLFVSALYRKRIDKNLQTVKSRFFFEWTIKVKEEHIKEF